VSESGQDRLSSHAVGGRYSFVSQTICINLPDNILNRLNGTQDYEDIEDTLLYTRMSHEIEHFRQNVITTYGLWKTLTLRMAAESYKRGLDSLAALNVPLVFPLDRMMVRGFNYSGAMRNFIIGSHYRAPIDYLENSFSINDNFPSDFVLNPRNSLNIHGTTNPFIGHKGTPHAITAGMLMEFQAINVQASALMSYRNIPNTHRQQISDILFSQMPFHLPVSAVAIALGRDKFPSQTTLSDFKKIRNIAHDLCTIALCPDWPADPLYLFTPLKTDPLGQSPLPTEPIWWQELHPGWRFMKMKRLIQSIDLTLDDVAASSEVVDLVCKKLKWETPTRALENFLHFCAHRAPHANLLQDILPQAGKIRELAAADGSPFDRHMATFRSPLRSLARGPNFTGQRVPRSVWEWDVALQLYLDGEVFCPYCISQNHQMGCPVRESILRYRRAS
jgi:hypothetical protein